MTQVKGILANSSCELLSGFYISLCTAHWINSNLQSPFQRRFMISSIMTTANMNYVEFHKPLPTTTSFYGKHTTRRNCSHVPTRLISSYKNISSSSLSTFVRRVYLEKVVPLYLSLAWYWRAVSPSSSNLFQRRLCQWCWNLPFLGSNGG